MSDPAKTDGQLAAAAEDPILDEITRRLVETYRPERIYLFGSRARHSRPGERLRPARGRARRRLRRPAAKHPSLRGSLGAAHVWRHPRVDPHGIHRPAPSARVAAVDGRARRETPLFPLIRCGWRTHAPGWFERGRTFAGPRSTWPPHRPCSGMQRFTASRRPRRR